MCFVDAPVYPRLGATVFPDHWCEQWVEKVRKVVRVEAAHHGGV